MSPIFLKNYLGKEKKIPLDFFGFIVSAMNVEKNLKHLSENIMMISGWIMT